MCVVCKMCAVKNNKYIFYFKKHSTYSTLKIDFLNEIPYCWCIFEYTIDVSI